MISCFSCIYYHKNQDSHRQALPTEGQLFSNSRPVERNCPVNNSSVKSKTMADAIFTGPDYIIRPIPGKGYGIVAARKIKTGERIFSEAPLLKLPRNVGSKEGLKVKIKAKLNSYPRIYRDAYRDLWNSYRGDSPEVGIALTNAYPLGPNASTTGIFLHAARLNHSCHPNAQDTWNEARLELTLHACCDIEEGEEITITLLSTRGCRKARQRVLKLNCGFTCLCCLCSLPPTKSKLSDERLEEIQRLNNQIKSPMVHLLEPLTTLHNVERNLRLMIKEGIADVSISRAYSDAFQVAISHGDQARAKIFADRALDSRIIVEGDDSEMVEKLRRLSLHPYTHPSHKITSKWKTSIEDAPIGFPDADLELWLWRQDQPRELQFADLRCTTNFPCFNDLPGEFDTSTDFFEAIDTFSCKPKKFWAFLGDILSVNDSDPTRLQLTAQDKNWKSITILLRTSEFGETFDRSTVKQGSSIVILFPVKDETVGKELGIVVDRLSDVKVFVDYNP